MQVHAGLGHHKLTTIHNPQLSQFLSESTETVEVLGPVGAPPGSDSSDASDASDGSASVELPVTVVKREAPVAPNPSPLVPVCPGRIRFF